MNALTLFQLKPKNAPQRIRCGAFLCAAIAVPATYGG